MLRAHKECPKCQKSMRYAEIPPYGRLWICYDCDLITRHDHVYRIEEQSHEPEMTKSLPKPKAKEEKRRSTKPCPECHQPMWAVTQPGYGTRHQCEECRLTVLFGGAIQKWRTRPSAPTTPS